MIISDKHRFVFIHIPKCAGTSVRRSLQPFDSRKGTFSDRVDHHTELGELDYVHIPLFALRDHFRPEFNVVQQYWSFAVVRDPYARFASSVSQRLRKYSNTPIQKRSVNNITSCILEIIDYLSRQRQEQVLLPPDYIHFQRQVDYIQVDGKRLVDSIYTVNQIDELLADVRQNTGQSLCDIVPEGTNTPANQKKVFRNDLLRRVIETTRPATEYLRKSYRKPLNKQFEIAYMFRGIDA